MATPRDRAWKDYSARFRREVLPKILQSAVVLSVVGDHEDIDVQQATELGAMLLLDKPLILLNIPGATIPSRLRRAADVVIEDWSPDNPDAQERLADAFKLISGEA